MTMNDNTKEQCTFITTAEGVDQNVKNDQRYITCTHIDREWGKDFTGTFEPVALRTPPWPVLREALFGMVESLKDEEGDDSKNNNRIKTQYQPPADIAYVVVVSATARVKKTKPRLSTKRLSGMVPTTTTATEPKTEEDDDKAVEKSLVVESAPPKYKLLIDDDSDDDDDDSDRRLHDIKANTSDHATVESKHCDKENDNETGLNKHADVLLDDNNTDKLNGSVHVTTVPPPVQVAPKPKYRLCYE